MQHFNSRNLTVDLARAEFQFIIHEKKPVSRAGFWFNVKINYTKWPAGGGEEKNSIFTFNPHNVNNALIVFTKRFIYIDARWYNAIG